MQKLVSMVWRNLQVVFRNIYQGVSDPSMTHRIELKTNYYRPVIRGRHLRKSWYRGARGLCILCSCVFMHSGPT